MKKNLYLIALALLTITACKKENSPPKINVLGLWYYTAYTVTYFDNVSNVIYKDIASKQILHDNPTFEFKADNTGIYNMGPFTYEHKTTNGTDSLNIFFDGGYTRRFAIVASDATHITLQSKKYDQETYFRDSQGHIIVSKQAQGYISLGRERVLEQ